MCYLGRFEWVEAEADYFPCIARMVNGTRLLFVAEKHAKIILLDQYTFPVHFNGLEKRLYLNGRYRMTLAEAELLTSINYDHLGKDSCLFPFYPMKDRIVLVRDVFEYCDMIKPRNRSVIRALGQ